MMSNIFIIFHFAVILVKTKDIEGIMKAFSRFYQKFKISQVYAWEIFCGKIKQ